jgi:hypothetical protein
VCLSQAAEERASAVLRARACYRERERAGERKREREMTTQDSTNSLY